MANLQKQVHIKSIDTGFFYTYKELKILEKRNELKKLKKNDLALDDRKENNKNIKLTTEKRI